MADPKTFTGPGGYIFTSYDGEPNVLVSEPGLRHGLIVPSHELRAFAAQPKRCADEMPPVGEDVLVWLAPGWVIASWEPDFVARGSRTAGAWVTSEIDRWDEPISYERGRVTHWCPLPDAPE